MLAAAGEGCHRERRAAGDGAVALQVFPGLRVEVTLGPGAEEFPPRITVARPPPEALPALGRGLKDCFTR